MRVDLSEVVKQGVREMQEAGVLDEHGEWRVSESERYGHSFHLGFAEGFAEGFEEAREAAEARFRAYLRWSIVQVLELRGFSLTDAQRERIAACDSLETLARWSETLADWDVAARTVAATSSVEALLSGEREPPARE